jgi:hypothetical protein
VQTTELNGADLNYWVARANNPGDPNVLRQHYGTGNGGNDPIDEPWMRQYIVSKLGNSLPPRETWQ